MMESVTSINRGVTLSPKKINIQKVQAAITKAIALNQPTQINQNKKAA